MPLDVNSKIKAKGPTGVESKERSIVKQANYETTQIRWYFLHVHRTKYVMSIIWFWVKTCIKFLKTFAKLHLQPGYPELSSYLEELAVH